MINYIQFIVVSFVLISIIGISLFRINILLLLLCLELLILAIIFNFVYFSYILFDASGQIIALLLLTISTVETSIGLCLVFVNYKQTNSVLLEDLCCSRF